MPYIPPEVVEKAREMDLLTYLKSYEPQELVHFGVESAAILRWTSYSRAKKSPLSRRLKRLWGMLRIAADLYARTNGTEAESFANAKSEPLCHSRRRVSAWTRY